MFEITDRSPESRVTIIHLPRDIRPNWLNINMPPDLHTLDTGSDHLRIFVRDDQPGTRAVVFQELLYNLNA